MAILDSTFWNKLSQISSSLGMDPKDILAVMYYESGLDSSIKSHRSDAGGLIQLMPDTLKGLGFQGSSSDFRNVDAVSQLDYVEKYIRNQMNYSGRPFKSATQYYVANLWPVALKLPGVINQDPNTPIIEKNPQFKKYPGVSLKKEIESYNANSGLDVNKDGIISYGDLDQVMKGVKSSSGFNLALNRMEQGKDLDITDLQKKQPKQENAVAKNTTDILHPKDKEDPSWLGQVSNLFDSYLQLVATVKQTNKMIKRANLKKLDKNVMSIKVNSFNFIDSLEFARILCLALDEEVQADTYTSTDGKNVEVNCTIYGPTDLCIKSVAQLSQSLENAFKDATKKIGGIKVKTNVIPNKTASNYKILDIDLAQSAYRQFHLKLI